MSEVKLDVCLLSYTPNPLAVIYTAFRQCYHSGFVGDMWMKLMEEKVSVEEQEKFVKQVLSSGHVSPLEHVSFTFAVQGVSRALTHQLVRHRIASYSQQSQRYVDGTDFSYILPPAIEKNARAKEVFEKCMNEIGLAYSEIKNILESEGRKEKSKEDARFVLPQAAETRIVLTMNCRTLLNFFEQRCCVRAQWEIRKLANSMLKLCKDVLPSVFGDSGAICERLKYCPEGEKFTCGKYPLRKDIVL